MEEVGGGTWVKYEDYAALEAKVAKLEERSVRLSWIENPDRMGQ
jgi:hypothetical protein